MKFYYFTEEQYALDNILNKHIKISLINNSNDPFENLWRQDDTINESQELFRNINTVNQGIICFSSRFTNPLMWGHYSSNHTGICLGFEIEESKLIKVKYTSSRENDYINASDVIAGKVKFPDINIKLNPEIKKSSDWAYEKEFRLSVPLINSNQIQNNFFFISFDDINIKLAEVILGYRCKADTVNLYRTLQYKYNNNIKLYSTKLSRTKFELELDEEINWGAKKLIENFTNMTSMSRQKI